jgi:hypothetical protein
METAGATPVPDKPIVWGFPEALSVKDSEAVREPMAEGVNVTLMPQVPLGTTAAPEQVSALLAKSLAFVPVRATLVIVRFAVPLLVTVTVWIMVVVPTS